MTRLALPTQFATPQKVETTAVISATGDVNWPRISATLIAPRRVKTRLPLLSAFEVKAVSV